jgi:rod shape-determining protein MreD
VSTPLLRRLDLLGSRLTPFAITVLLILIGAVPLPVPAWHLLAPSLPLIAVFFWTLHRPEDLPPTAAFLLGLGQDIISVEPLGLNGLTFLVICAGVDAQRRFFHGRSFGIVWLGFAVAAVTAALAAWLISCVYFGQLIPGGPALLQALSTIGWFPVICRLLLGAAMLQQPSP